ncbi:hypothetical protein [Ornithinimicrobium cryptoxanthini]|uniref:DUF559 domain-containing protein n=1 Tax=Ornithinimicrobium cryptoxanthini TaxID=2934161 RepID=A0ABY4YG29_9MICO|nr:hypothetical protein [Ornithinimicrobium cryptoxanthini]USQ75731.1 hypothetical protein NF557_14120 [Ornithinimicrobium cryptoxanthini]
MGDLRQAVRALTPAERREMVARELGARHDGAARLDELYALGLTYDQVLAETRAGRWHRLGRRTIGLIGPEPSREASWCVAVWESGSGAVLDGPSSLLAAGLRSWEETVVHVSVPRGTRTRPADGVRIHHQRRMGRTLNTDPPRTAPEVAALRAAGWATSDRQALTVLAMSVQQRLILPSRLLKEWEATQRHRRGALLSEAVPLVCDGAHALGELDFARARRRHGLPEPSRQEVRRTSQGLIYLDVRFGGYAVHVEINGAQHYTGLGPVADARRRNDRTLHSDLTLEIPVLGLLIDEAGFMAQVAEALRQRGWGGRAA